MSLRSFIFCSLVLASVALVVVQSSFGQVAPRHQGKWLIEIPRNWIDDDVPWIITAEERQGFHQLKNDDERNFFIDDFWLRRDPTPKTEMNEFKDEYYRRVLAANEKFGAGSKQGWRTDRGRIYILYGPPDSISSGARNLPPGAAAKTESWHYKFLEGVGSDAELDFADRTADNDYRLELPDWADASVVLAPPVPAGSRDSEIAKALREHPGQPIFGFGLNSPPPVRFKELEEIVNHKITYRLFPIAVSYSVIRATKNISVVTVKVTLPELNNREHPFGAGAVHAFIRVTNMAGRVVATSEESIEDPRLTGTTQISAAIELLPGTSRLDVAIHDVASDSKSSLSMLLKVPEAAD